MDRKEFLKTCGFACVSGVVLSALLQSCANTNYFAQNTLENNKITIKKTEFLKIENDKKGEHKYVLVKNDKYEFPICIYKHGVESYSALLMKCTHRGCELQPHGDYLHCPCHGSEFTNKGVVQNPPAEQNLQTFKTTTDSENIYIQL